jgi:hypothetical protein
MFSNNTYIDVQPLLYTIFLNYINISVSTLKESSSVFQYAVFYLLV